MNALTAAIYAKLSGDTTLTAMLATYNGAPAIISANPVPGDVPRPYVVIRGAMHDEPFGGKVESLTGRDIEVDIMAYVGDAVGGAPGSSLVIDGIIERIRTLLHNQTLTVSGFANIIAYCKAGPIEVPTAPQIMGRALTMRWFLN